MYLNFSLTRRDCSVHGNVFIKVLILLLNIAGSCKRYSVHKIKFLNSHGWSAESHKKKEEYNVQKKVVEKIAS